jgi:hypothetical protein
MLADPELRALYNKLRRNPTIPVPFPYAGFGSLVVRGGRAAENGVQRPPTFASESMSAFREAYRKGGPKGEKGWRTPT